MVETLTRSPNTTEFTQLSEQLPNIGPNIAEAIESGANIIHSFLPPEITTQIVTELEKSTGKKVGEAVAFNQNQSPTLQNVALYIEEQAQKIFPDWQHWFDLIGAYGPGEVNWGPLHTDTAELVGFVLSLTGRADFDWYEPGIGNNDATKLVGPKHTMELKPGDLTIIREEGLDKEGKPATWHQAHGPKDNQARLIATLFNKAGVLRS